MAWLKLTENLTMIRKIVKYTKKLPGKIFQKTKKILKKSESFIERKIERNLILTKHYKTEEMSISDLMLIQSDHEELLRWDIIVRYLAIENYYGKNDYGWELYRKMQKIRICDGYEEQAVEQFKNLIGSYEKSGYDKSSGILVDKNLHLIDGSHRIALALYHGIPNITVNIVKTRHPVEYSVDWFLMNGFSYEEIHRIKEKYVEIFSGLDKCFTCIIWAPAVSLVKNISEDIALYADIISEKEYCYESGTYDNIVKALYSVDDIEKWKIDKKIEHMKGYDPRLIKLDLLFKDPKFRIKNSSGLPLSQQAEKIKKTLRKKYSSYIADYYFDIILHIGDNVYQSMYMNHVLNEDIDFTKLIDILDKYTYAFVKIDVPYMPSDFPLSIPVCKDADILCLENELNYISQEVFETYKNIDGFTTYRIEEKNGSRIRIQWGKTLYYQIDLSFAAKGMDRSYVKDALDARIKSDKGYYILAPAYEYVYRANSYAQNPQKLQHKKYLQEHAHEMDSDMITKYCNVDINKILNK